MNFDGVKEIKQPRTAESARDQQPGYKRPDAPSAGQYDIRQWLYWSY